MTKIKKEQDSPGLLPPPHALHMTSKLRTWRNFELSPSDIEHPTGVSQTVPDQTPDLKTLLQKRQNGHIVPVLDGRYTDHEIPDFELMDEVEIIQYRMDLAETMEDAKEFHHRASKELEKRKKAEAEKLKDPPVDGGQP